MPNRTTILLALLALALFLPPTHAQTVLPIAPAVKPPALLVHSHYAILVDAVTGEVL